MIKKLYPKYYEDSLFNINFERLWDEGIRGLLFDIDNTLVPYDCARPTEAIVHLFEKLQERGFQVCLVSNNNYARVMTFNESLNLFAVHKAKKPRRLNLNKCLKQMQLEKNQIAIVGDQVFTDVLAGNRFGITTILVMPVSEKDEWITRIKRGMEKRVLKSYEKSQRKAK